MKYSKTLDISAPAERIWEALTDFERWPEWLPFVEKVERLGPTFSLAVGDKLAIKDDPEGPQTYTIVEATEPEALTIRAGTFFMWSERRTLIEPDRTSSCKVTVTFRNGGIGLLPLGWLLGRFARSGLDKEADALKRFSESA